MASIPEADVMIDRGEWFWLHGRPKHPSFIISMRFFTVRGYIASKMLRRAIPTTEES